MSSKTVGQKTMLDVWNYIGDVIAAKNNYYKTGSWGQFNNGKQCFDCVCVIKACGWGVPVNKDITSEQYKYIADNKTTMPDVSISSFYKNATKKNDGLSTLPTDTISFLYQGNAHIGVYNPKTKTVREVCAGETMGAREKALSDYTSDFWTKWSGASYFTESVVTAASKETETVAAILTIYRVRKSWADASSQVGAYKNLDNAKKKCDSAGNTVYTVYDENGVAVYGAGFNAIDNVHKTDKGYAFTAVEIPYYTSATGVALGKRSGTFYVWSDEVINNRIRITKNRKLVGINGGVTCWVCVDDYE